MREQLRNIKISKILAGYLAAVMLLFSPVGVTFAQTPTPPAPPEAPTNDSTPPPAPTPPAPPEAPTNDSTPPPAPTPPSQPPADSGDDTTQTTADSEDPATDETTADDAGVSSNGNIGDTTIETADATNDGNVLTTGNTNASSGSASGSSASTTVVNSDNGEGSTNSGSATVSTTDETSQTNSAHVENAVDESSVTGQNSASFNLGDSLITTGDANTTATVVTAVNTNVDGVAVAEFNIVDDHVGDIVLDFGDSCVSGCGGTDTTIKNSGNGANSTNDASADIQTTDATGQTNDAAIVTDLNLAADTGNNDASFNNGDSTIVTGDANIDANVLTFANTNVAGNVVFGVVNIFGDLIGNIILTQEALDAFCGGTCTSNSTTVENSGNLAGSTNTADLNLAETDTTNQFNTADITNNLILTADTGSNQTSFNTNGDSTIQTGNANIDANVVNVANLNLAGGNWWLVFVNEAGNWIGRLIGFGDAGMAGSDGLEFTTDANGQVVVSNSGNGADSTNTSNLSVTNDNSVSQENTAVVENNINLSANTGGNTTSYNTGGNSSITTGDANIIANIVNFVNTNIVGDGNLFVTMINVFGSWIGDFVGPGQTADPTIPDGDNTGSSDNNQGNSSSQQTTSSSESSTSTETVEDGTTVLSSTATKYSYNYFATTKIGDDAEVELAAPESGLSAETAAQKAVINLAWLIVVFPALILTYFITRKKIVPAIAARRARGSQ